MKDECNTCGDTGRWESTLEDDPNTLVDLGPCPDCNPHPEWPIEPLCCSFHYPMNQETENK